MHGQGSNSRPHVSGTMLEDLPSCDIEGVRGSLIRFQQGGSKMPLVGKGVSVKMRSQRDTTSADHLLSTCFRMISPLIWKPCKHGNLGRQGPSAYPCPSAWPLPPMLPMIPPESLQVVKQQQHAARCLERLWGRQRAEQGWGREAQGQGGVGTAELDGRGMWKLGDEGGSDGSCGSVR
jgi:hypothetical protein